MSTTVAKSIIRRATTLKQEAQCLAKNPSGEAQKNEFARIVRREISGLYRDLMSMGVSVHGLYVRYGDKDLYFQAEPLRIRRTT